MTVELIGRYREVLDRVAAAAARAGRAPEEVTLVAVSKTVPAQTLAALGPLGGIVLGENRVQEAGAKIEQLTTGGARFRWHMIGHLQANKVNRAVALFECIHSVDSCALLQKLETRCSQLGKDLPVFIELNLGGEAAKTGAEPAELPALLEVAGRCRWVRAVGLMTVPPYLEDPEQVRPYFRRLRELRDEARHRGWAGEELAGLSMGMSHDFEVAIQEGATHVRVGTAIFGSRRA